MNIIKNSIKIDVIKNSTKIELLQLYRSKLNYLFFILPVFYSLDILKNNNFEYYSLSAYAVQILIFGSMLIGFYTYTNEIRYNCEEIFFILDFRLTKFISKLLSDIIYF